VTLGNQTSWIDGSVANGVTYYYKVSALNAVGESVASNELWATPSQPAGPPGAPSLVGAVAGNAVVALSWNPPSSNGGSAITGYRVYRSTSSGAETLWVTLGNVTSWTDSGVANGVTYYYRVSALNAVGEGFASNELSARPASLATAPGAPGLNSAIAGNAVVSLSWNPPASNGGSAVTGYRVYRGTASGTETLLVTLGNQTSWIDGSVANGVTYYYKVSALNAVGESVASNELWATPTASASAPGAPGLNYATAGNATVSLSWSPPASNGGSAVTGYRVYRGTSSGTETLLVMLGNQTSWTDSSVSNGTTYYYRVSALNAAGEGVASNELAARPTASATAPDAPGLNSATAGNATVALSWNPPSDSGGSAVTGYRVYRSTSGGTETLLVTLGNQTSWADTSVANGITYYYKVSALNAVGESAASNELSATPAASTTTAGAPTLMYATAGNGTVSLTWSPPGDNGGSAITGYRVYRSTSSGTETLLLMLGNQTSWTDSSVRNGTTYYYRVSALNAAGEGVASNELSALPGA
jgi:fibronectin type 3 domain-containing protein